MKKQPSSLDVKFKNVPSNLKAWDQWLVWCFELDEDGKTWKKVPHRSDGNRADYTDESDHMSYDDAEKQLKLGDYNGLMFVVTENDSFTAVDIDHCIKKNGKFTKLAKEIMEQLDNTYWEISPSGKGLRGFVIGEMPDIDEYYRHNKITAKKLVQGLEMADENKPFTVTGHHLKGMPKSIKKNQDGIDAVCDKYMKRKTPLNAEPEQSITTDKALADDEILKLCRYAKNKDKFEKLWSGDSTGYESQSQADQALCSIFAFYTKDFHQLDRLFRMSQLGKREKWTSRPDYRVRTLDTAIRGVKESYQPKRLKDKPDESTKDKPKTKKNLFLEWDEKKQVFKLDEMQFLKWLEKRGFGYLLFNGQRLLFRSRKNVIELMTEADVKNFVMDYLRARNLNNELEVVHKGSSRIFGKWFINSLSAKKKMKFLCFIKMNLFRSNSPKLKPGLD